MSGGQIHRGGTTVLSLAMVVIGIALAIEAVIGAGGVVSMRLLLGLLFAAAGIGRLYIEVKRRRGA